ncbi:enoyl-CoA hydratase-related protein [Methylopila sp. 73B]|uniref:enoyl-CoA hydratase-related protein n=1 Tax=Methylopila sp. 73B TaxID=1120792 RepID=UPI000382B7B6|nr:enoyl-CoA hydratase-related protein [Methylopila sp. 73B]
MDERSANDATAAGGADDLAVCDAPEPYVLRIRLNRPRQRNALNNALISHLAAKLADAAADDHVRCVLLCGQDRFFSAGADLKEMLAQGFEAIDNATRRAAWDAITAFPKPVVAAVEGYAFGGGHELVMLADIVVAGESATFAQPEIKIGILPGDGATQRLTRIVGKPLAMKMILTGEPIAAATALAVGLVSELAPDGGAEAAALAIAASIATRPPLSVQYAKRAVLAAYETPLSAGLQAERDAIRQAFETEDQKEGMRAFVEGRAPVFQGR